MEIEMTKAQAARLKKAFEKWVCPAYPRGDYKQFGFVLAALAGALYDCNIPFVCVYHAAQAYCDNED